MYERIDHIVYAVLDLQSTTKKFSSETGLKVFPGGQHPDHGTHNALVRIGKSTYLEFIAKDISITPVHSKTWMGLDYLKEDKITRWALASENVEKDAALLKIYQPELGKVVIGNRAKSNGTMLNWLMTNALASPAVEPAPFLLDWKKSQHPTFALPLDCSIQGFHIEHSESQVLEKLLEQLGAPYPVQAANESSLRLTLDTPKGQFTI